jgi:hypothetical protein
VSPTAGTALDGFQAGVMVEMAEVLAAARWGVDSEAAVRLSRLRSQTNSRNVLNRLREVAEKTWDTWLLHGWVAAGYVWIGRRDPQPVAIVVEQLAGGRPGKINCAVLRPSSAGRQLGAFTCFCADQRAIISLQDPIEARPVLHRSAGRWILRAGPNPAHSLKRVADELTSRLAKTHRSRVSPEHLAAYVAEFALQYNSRRLTIAEKRDRLLELALSIRRDQARRPASDLRPYTDADLTERARDQVVAILLKYAADSLEHDPSAEQRVASVRQRIQLELVPPEFDTLPPIAGKPPPTSSGSAYIPWRRFANLERDPSQPGLTLPDPLSPKYDTPRLLEAWQAAQRTWWDHWRHGSPPTETYAAWRSVEALDDALRLLVSDPREALASTRIHAQLPRLSELGRALAVQILARRHYTITPLIRRYSVRRRKGDAWANLRHDTRTCLASALRITRATRTAIANAPHKNDPPSEESSDDAEAVDEAALFDYASVVASDGTSHIKTLTEHEPLLVPLPIVPNRFEYQEIGRHTFGDIWYAHYSLLQTDEPSQAPVALWRDRTQRVERRHRLILSRLEINQRWFNALLGFGDKPEPLNTLFAELVRTELLKPS